MCNTFDYSNLTKKKEEILNLIERYGFLIIKNLPKSEENKHLLSLATSLGEIWDFDIRPNSNFIEQNCIYRVEWSENNAKDYLGKKVISSTSDFFPLHTDGFFRKKIPHIVFLHCWRRAAKGGASLISSLKDFEKKLSPESIRILSNRDFANIFGNCSILTKEEKMKSYNIRFNYDWLMAGCKLWKTELSVAQKNAIHELMNLVNIHKKTIYLEEGDCLVVDNRKVLHGRTEFEENSKRLLKRVRVVYS